nr:rhamnogalacturonan acetylesterase [Ruficoccus amylovorans]
MFLFVSVFGYAVAASAFGGSPGYGPLTIGIIGDSTVCDYPEENPLRGWGQMLPDYLAEDVIVINEAKPGCSTKTFPPERWQKLLAARPDFVLIQFGHNDSHAKGRPESTDADSDFKDYLRRFIREARQAGIAPILVTPPHRRLFKNGQVTHELLPYAKAMKAVADEEGVPLVDLQAMSGDEFQSLGEDGSAFYNVHGKGADDRTHFSEAGARRLAMMVSTNLATIDPSLESVVVISEP